MMDLRWFSKKGGIENRLAVTRYWFLSLALLALAVSATTAVAGCGSSADSSPVVITGAGSADAEGAAGHTAAPADAATTADSKPVFETLGFPASLPSPARSVKLPILMFHHTGEPPAGANELRRNLTVSTADFEAQISYLKQAGYQPVSEAQLFKALYNNAPLPPRAVMLTFDDGYLDNYQVAAPILEKYGFPATFYIITEKVGTPEYMDWEQVADLDRRLMDIGSHTATHQDLTILSGADLKQELSGAAETFKSRLGHPVYWLCYPAGKYDADVIKYSRDAGYLLATTTKPGEEQSSDDPFGLLRYRVRSDTGLEGFKELVR
ncbi:MAG: polysaccharide deacetylase family protein [Actinomycetota bacterium]